MTVKQRVTATAVASAPQVLSGDCEVGKRQDTKGSERVNPRSEAGSENEKRGRLSLFLSRGRARDRVARQSHSSSSAGEERLFSALVFVTEEGEEKEIREEERESVCDRKKRDKEQVKESIARGGRFADKGMCHPHHSSPAISQSQQHTGDA